MDSTRRLAGSISSGSAKRRCALPNRQVFAAIASRFANRRLAFSIGAISILSAKCIHIYAHVTALPPAELVRWGLSFFAQDTALLLLLRLLLDGDLPLFAAVRVLRLFATTVGCLIVFVQLALAAINISFFVVAGSELHWRNIGLAADSSSWSVLVTGLVACSLAYAAILLIGWIFQDISYVFVGMALDIVKLPFTFLFSKIPLFRRATAETHYDHIPQKDVDLEDGSDNDFKEEQDNQTPTKGRITAPTLRESKLMWLLYTVIGILLVAQVVLSIVRPNESSLIFMSWTPILLPFVDFAHSSPTLAGLLPFYGTGIGWAWDNQTALAQPPHFDWLPEEELPGFKDWYERGSQHYNAESDPLKISNLEDDLLAPLRGKLGGVDIRHVVLIKLESTRKDVFPIKRNGQIWNKFAETWENNTLPEEVVERLATLTPTANFLTGDYDDGFEHNVTARRGGINVQDDHTTGTYTLKSLPGTICGINPLVADFNAEYSHHIYQPCLPHIFNAFNALNDSKNSVQAEDEYTRYKWSNSFMMSVTNRYDKQDLLMPKMGFAKDEIISKEYLQSADAKFGKVTIPEINYYGMPEVAIEDYIKDAFKTAHDNNERLFLTHLTSTSHHPFKMPDDETYVPLAAEKKLEDLSHYTNAIGYVDRWLAKILDIIEEQGATNDTLVVLVGDHGLSVVETGAVTPYYQPNVGNFHVPLVMSHPNLPPININGSVNSISILPTILDLLIETGSLTESDRKAASDLLRNYEGQSLIRPLHKESKSTGKGDWQFSVMNPGRAQISTRDARETRWRLVVPAVKDTAWRFTDLETDPREKHGILNFDFVAFLKAVEKKYGVEAAHWAEEAAFMTRWWVDDNARRWHYSP